MHRLKILLPLVLAFGCARQADVSHEDQSKKKWQAEGWTFFEIVGVSDPNADEISFSSSDSAKSITAFAFDGAERKRKEYFQTDARYLVVTMSSKADHTYSLVFRRPKK